MTPPRPEALSGIRVLDLTRLLPGAFCSLLLADQGAEVIKIEQPGSGDYNRAFAPINKQESGSFLLLNRNKKSLTLNLKTQAGKEIFFRLLDTADVVLEGFRPGVMARLGLDYDTLATRNPRIVYCAISGYGQDGPHVRVSGHDINYLAQAGALQLFAERGRQPIVPGLSIADVGGGSLTAVFGILTALLARQTTGRGQFVDVAMLDGVVSWLTYHGADYLFAGIEPRGGERPFLGRAPCYNVYTCADGRHISLGIIEEHFWHRFCDLIDRPDFKDEQWPAGKKADEQYAQIAARFASEDCDTWVQRLIEADVPVAPVNTMQEAFDDPQIRHREMLQYVDHPVEGRIPQLGFPVKFSDTPARIKSPPPLLGEHTEEVLTACGYDERAIRQMRNEGVV